MQDLVIRKATKEDLPALLYAEQEIIRTERPFDPTLRPGEFHYYDLSKMIGTDAAEVLIAELDGAFAGCGNARIKTGMPYNTFERYAFLGCMYVLPEHRGKGIIQSIIGELKKWAAEKGLDEIQLQVYSDNIAAIKAYEKVGFQKMLVDMRIK